MEEARQFRVEAEGARRLQAEDLAWWLQVEKEGVPPLQAENEEARLLQVVRRRSTTSDYRVEGARRLQADKE